MMGISLWSSLFQPGESVVRGLAGVAVCRAAGSLGLSGRELRNGGIMRRLPPGGPTRRAEQSLRAGR